MIYFVRLIQACVVCVKGILHFSREKIGARAQDNGDVSLRWLTTVFPRLN